MSTEEKNIAIESLTMEDWEELGQAGNDQPATISTRGISMWPLLRYKDDSIRVVYPNRELKIGDFVLCRKSDGRFIAHRITWMDESNIETLGDNLDKSDGRFPKSEVIGIVTHVCRKGKLFSIDTKFWNHYGRFMIWSNPFRMFVRNKMYRPVRGCIRKIVKGK